MCHPQAAAFHWGAHWHKSWDESTKPPCENKTKRQKSNGLNKHPLNFQVLLAVPKKIWAWRNHSYSDPSYPGASNRVIKQSMFFRLPSLISEGMCSMIPVCGTAAGACTGTWKSSGFSKKKTKGQYNGICFMMFGWYCWWKKSQTTTWHVWNLVNNGIFTISTGEWVCRILNHSTNFISGSATSRAVY